MREVLFRREIERQRRTGSNAPWITKIHVSKLPRKSANCISNCSSSSRRCPVVWSPGFSRRNRPAFRTPSNLQGAHPLKLGFRIALERVHRKVAPAKLLQLYEFRKPIGFGARLYLQRRTLSCCLSHRSDRKSVV